LQKRERERKMLENEEEMELILKNTSCSKKNLETLVIILKIN
jgi:hypothetical protein